MAEVTPMQSLDDVLEFIPVSWYHYRLFLMCGLSFMADSMEVALLAFISKCAGVEWNLTGSEKAFIVSVVFIGELFGSVVWGPVADHFGRVKAFLLVSITISLAGFAAAFSPSYTFLLVFLGFVGFGIGGLTVPFDLLAEFLPSSHRGRALLYINYFWTSGSMLVNGAAWVLLSERGWRLLTLITAIPVFLSTILSLFYLPESPRWLLEQGRVEEAETVLKAVAKMNGADLPPFRLALDENEFDSSGKPLHKGANYFDLVRTSKMRWITIPQWSAWGLFGFFYYGIILFITRVYTTTDSVDNGPQCSFDYQDVFINSSAEIIGVFFATLFIDRWGRMPTQVVFFILGGVAATTLGFSETFPSGAQLAVGMVGRLSMMAAVATSWVACPELYVTRYRATAHAACSGIQRIGAFFAPFFAMSALSDQIVGLTLGATGVLTAVFVSILPETMGMDIDDIAKLTAEDDEISGGNESAVDRSSHNLLGARSDSAGKKRFRLGSKGSLNGRDVEEGAKDSVAGRLSKVRLSKEDSHLLRPDANSVN